jgi:hypothetical protein
MKGKLIDKYYTRLASINLTGGANVIIKSGENKAYYSSTDQMLLYHANRNKENSGIETKSLKHELSRLPGGETIHFPIETITRFTIEGSESDE